MAVVKIENTKLNFNKAGTIPAAVAVDASDGAAVVYSGKEDARILVIIENADSGDKKATVTAGGGVQGVSDLEITVSGTSKAAVVLESGVYVQTEGDNRGCVVIKGEDDNIKIAAIELP